MNFAICSAVSLMRVAKPHSLSYQLNTRASLPSMTWVWGRATVEDAAVWLMSMDTTGSLVIARIPLSGPDEAALVRASLISATLVSRPVTTFRSTTETFGVGSAHRAERRVW